MKTVVASALVIAGLVAAPVSAEEAKPLRMITFNIYSDWHVKDGGVKPREVGVERTLLKIKPDIAALQEVSGHWWASPMFEHLSDTYGIVRGDMADALRRAGPPPSAKDGKLPPESASHTPLLYRKGRLKLLDSGFDIFHVSLGTSKGVTWAVFEDRLDGRRFISFSTHFWFKHKAKEDDALRELNVRHILWRVAEVRRKWGDIPVIGGGDLNCSPGSLALETFRREGYSNAMEAAAEKTARSATRTYHGYPKPDEKGVYHGTVAPPGMDKPEQSIDHIFFTAGVRALKYDLDLDQDTLDVSDHSPVVVDFLITCDPVPKTPTLIVVGDSLTADRPTNAVVASWARALEKYMKPGCTIDNHARGGASTKSFFVSGRWANAVKAVKPGDYVLIQFGGNDQKWHTDFYLEKRFADHKTTFRDYIRQFVKEVRAKGGKPVLVSENVRGTFDENGKLFDKVDEKGISLACYATAMRETAEELKTEFVDMNKLTHDLLVKLGKEESLKFYVISSGKIDPKTGKPSTDTNHTVKAGAEAYAKLFYEDVKKRNLEIAEIFN